MATLWRTFTVKVILATMLALVGCGGQDNPLAPIPENAQVFEFFVDPETRTVTFVEPATSQALHPKLLPSDTRILVPDEDLALVDYEASFLDGNRLVIRARFKNITADLEFLQPFFFTLNERTETGNIVRATAPLVTDADLGGDGVLSPGETTSRLRFEVVHKGRPFTFFVDASAVENTGALHVEMSGLPGPWPRGGYVTVRGPQGFERNLFRSQTLEGLAVGSYTIHVQELPLCEEVYRDERSPFTVEVRAGTTPRVEVVYQPEPLISSQAFSAGVGGAHSDLGTTTGKTTFALEGNHLEAFGCVRKRGGDPIKVKAVRVLKGNAKDHFFDRGRHIRSLESTGLECREDDPNSCFVHYIHGSSRLTPSEVAALEAGDYYTNIITDTMPFAMPGQILSDAIVPDKIPTRLKGGNLTIEIDYESLEVRLRDKVEVCVGAEGSPGSGSWPHDSLWQAFRATSAVGVCVTRDMPDRSKLIGFDNRSVCTVRGGSDANFKRLVCEDLFSDTYFIEPDSIHGLDSEFRPEIHGSPAIVRPGEVKTITVSFLPEEDEEEPEEP